MHRAFVASLAIFVFGGCSGPSNASTGTKTESGTTSNTNPTPDASPPVSNDQATPICNARFAYDQRCADTAEMRSQACLTGRASTCPQFVQTMSAPYRAAVVACYTSSLQCGDDDTCITQQLTSMTPTAAMLKVRDDYCATCGVEAGPNCKDGFFQLSTDNGNGPGYLILQVSDAVAAQIDKDCTGSALDIAGSGTASCPEAFQSCAVSDQQSAQPQLPDACYPQTPDQTGDGGDQGTDGGVTDATPPTQTNDAATDGPTDARPG